MENWKLHWEEHRARYFSSEKVKVEVTQSYLTLCDPMDYTVHGILQARILKWVAFPFSRGSSQPRDRTQVSRIAGGFFTSWATREAPNTQSVLLVPLEYYQKPHCCFSAKVWVLPEGKKEYLKVCTQHLLCLLEGLTLSRPVSTHSSLCTSQRMSSIEPSAHSRCSTNFW